MWQRDREGKDGEGQLSKKGMKKTNSKGKKRIGRGRRRRRRSRHC